MMLCIAVLCVMAMASASPLPPIKELLPSLKGSPVTRYQSDFTRDIFVKQIHSHNDYWRDVPLYTALSYGVQSVEADVWHFEDDEVLYVGHHEAALGPQRTLASLYIDPLVQILSQANPENKFTSEQKKPNGVFDTWSSATLYLFIDVKTKGNETWPYVENALQPLLEKGWLTQFNGTAIVPGPVTVIGTGNTPAEYVSSLSTRSFFVDGPLANLTDSTPYTLNPIASGSLAQLIGVDGADQIDIKGLNESQLGLLNETVTKAHSMGIMTRLWDVPWWPVEKRNQVWSQILAVGSDFLNADDLELASEFLS